MKWVFQLPLCSMLKSTQTHMNVSWKFCTNEVDVWKMSFDSWCPTWSIGTASFTFYEDEKVEKSKQSIRTAVWSFDLTGRWRGEQVHLVITYLFSLITSASISCIWKGRNVKGWYVVIMKSPVLISDNSMQTSQKKKKLDIFWLLWELLCSKNMTKT